MINATTFEVQQAMDLAKVHFDNEFGYLTKQEFHSLGLSDEEALNRFRRPYTKETLNFVYSQAIALELAKFLHRHF